MNLDCESGPPAAPVGSAVMTWPLADERARQFALELLPPGTKLASMRLTDLRESIAKKVEVLMRIQDEAEQIRQDRRTQA